MSTTENKNDFAQQYKDTIAQIRSKYPSCSFISNVRPIPETGERISAVLITDPSAGYLVQHEVVGFNPADDHKQAVINAAEMLDLSGYSAAPAPAMAFNTAPPAAEDPAAPVEDKPKRGRGKGKTEAEPAAVEDAPAPPVNPALKDVVPAEAEAAAPPTADTGMEARRTQIVQAIESIYTSMGDAEKTAWAKYLQPRFNAKFWDEMDTPAIIELNNLFVAASKAAALGDPYGPVYIDPDYANFVNDNAPASSGGMDIDDEDEPKTPVQVNAPVRPLEAEADRYVTHVAKSNTGIYAKMNAKFEEVFKTSDLSQMTDEQLEGVIATVKKQIAGGKLPEMASGGVDL